MRKTRSRHNNGLINREADDKEKDKYDNKEFETEIKCITYKISVLDGSKHVHTCLNVTVE